MKDDLIDFAGFVLVVILLAVVWVVAYGANSHQ